MSDEKNTKQLTTGTTQHFDEKCDSTPQPPSGIDITAAMSILSTRSKMGGEKELHEENTSATISEEKKGMGQTIDLFEWAKEKQCECREKSSNNEDNNIDPEILEKKKMLEEESRTREAKMRSKLELMDIASLLRATFEAQKERAMTYKSFDRGLDTVLSTGNMTNYPAICAKATASFAVLSNTINSIKSVLIHKHKRKDLGKLLSQLQQHEKEKLNLTAALHLERIREKNEVEVDGKDERICNLFSEGVISLRKKIGSCIENINEILEELRYTAADLNQC